MTFSSILTSCLAIWLSISKGHFTLHDALHILGYWPLSLVDLFKTFLLVATLFLGPLFERAVCEGQWRDWIRPKYWIEALETPTRWRTYVAVGPLLTFLTRTNTFQGPVTEEVVFRSTIITVHLLARVSPTKLVFITPLHFGIAHVHHFYETTLTHPYTPKAAILLRTVIQFAYTSLFGFFAAFLLLRTGNVYACILAHSFCNAMGLPRVWGRVERIETPIIMAPEGTVGGRDTRAGGVQVEVADGRLGLQWTVAYYVLLVLGASLFYHNIWTWTESTNALVEFGGAGKGR